MCLLQPADATASSVTVMVTVTVIITANSQNPQYCGSAVTVTVTVTRGLILHTRIRIPRPMVAFSSCRLIRDLKLVRMLVRVANECTCVSLLPEVLAVGAIGSGKGTPWHTATCKIIDSR